jgi:hypothetical protein
MDKSERDEAEERKKFSNFAELMNKNENLLLDQVDSADKYLKKVRGKQNYSK